MTNKKPIPIDFVNIRNTKRNYKYDIQKAKKPTSIQNQLGILYNKALKVTNNTLILPKGLSVTNRIFYDEIFIQ